MARLPDTAAFVELLCSLFEGEVPQASDELAP